LGQPLRRQTRGQVITGAEFRFAEIHRVGLRLRVHHARIPTGRTLRGGVARRSGVRPVVPLAELGVGLCDGFGVVGGRVQFGKERRFRRCLYKKRVIDGKLDLRSYSPSGGCRGW
jgi:hypothetical protein